MEAILGGDTRLSPAAPVSGVGETPPRDSARRPRRPRRLPSWELAPLGRPGPRPTATGCPAEPSARPQVPWFSDPTPPESAALLEAKLGPCGPEAGLRLPGPVAKTTISRVRSGGGAGVRRLMPRKLAFGFLKVAFCLPSACRCPFWLLGLCAEGVAFGNVQGLERWGARSTPRRRDARIWLIERQARERLN